MVFETVMIFAALPEAMRMRKQTFASVALVVARSLAMMFPGFRSPVTPQFQE
jgi:hypothetical protein